MLKTLCVVAVALSLGACAISPGPGRSKTGIPGVDDDMVKVASVNQWAAEKGATVVWIHMPTKAPDNASPSAH